MGPQETHQMGFSTSYVPYKLSASVFLPEVGQDEGGVRKE
jgi:hypothetical protein